MKSSLGLLAGLISAVSLIAGASYPTLAQTNSNPGSFNQDRGQFNQNRGSQQPTVMVPNATDSLSISSIVSTSPSFEMFNSLLQVAGLTNADLTGQLDTNEGEYIVYAPTDEAFAALPEGTIKMLVQPENRDLLVQMISSHIRPIEGNDMASAGVPDANGVIAVPNTRVEDRDSPSRVDDMAQNSGIGSMRGDNEFNSSSSSGSSSSQSSDRISRNDNGVPDANGVIEVPETRVEDRDSPSRVDDMAQNSGTGSMRGDNEFNSSDSSGSSDRISRNDGNVPDANGVIEVPETRVEDRDSPSRVDDMATGGTDSSTNPNMSSRDRNRPSISSNRMNRDDAFINAQVIGSGIEANNGVIYAIDQVIIPGNVGTELGLSGTGEVLTPAF